MPASVRVVTLLCVAEVLSMTAVASYPALLPVLAREWTLTSAEAGIIGGVFYGGYMAAVPLLTGLTDRADARRIYLFSCGLAATGAAGFSTLARGLWSAVLFQALLGAGLAGTYMPGLRLLSDHVEGPGQSRAVSFYTSSFGLGSALSLWLAGAAFSADGWRAAFALSAGGPLAAGPLVYLALAAPRAQVTHEAAFVLRFRAVFRNVAAFTYIARYAAHCWELFGARSWLVAFFAFSATLQPDASPLASSAASAAAAINLLGPPASILGNELAVRSGRRRFVRVVQIVCLTLACLVGFTAQLPWLLVFLAAGLYFVAIMSDSAALTAGLVDAASREERGATLAVHSFLGFGAAFIAPIVFGLVLDGAGGAAQPLAWGLAFASLGVGYALVWMMEIIQRTRAR